MICFLQIDIYIFLKKQTDNDLVNLGMEVVNFFQLALEIDSET